MHIGRLTRNVTKDHVTEIFSVYGKIKSIEMPMDRVHSEYSRLFAYVDYEKAEEAEAAVDHMDGGELRRFHSPIVPEPPYFTSLNFMY